MSWAGYVTDLVAFGEVLDRQPETQATADGLRTEAARFALAWSEEHSLVSSKPGIRLPIPRRGHHPTECEVDEAWLTFAFQVEGDDSPLPRRADYQIRVVGSLLYPEGAALTVEDHWRVDTHQYNIVPEAGLPAPNEPHALFHFQRGGYAFESFAAGVGYVPGRDLPVRGDGVWLASMHNDGPRVPHLPMCPIIAIDYVLGQHDGRVLRRLRESPEYGELVRSAQDRIWTPFLTSLSTRLGQKAWLGELIA